MDCFSIKTIKQSRLKNCVLLHYLKNFADAISGFQLWKKLK